MSGLSQLILPILLSGVIVFIASSIVHMFTPWHKNDFAKVPNEERARDAIGGLGIPPGDYMIPKCDTMEEMKSPEFAEKMKKGPVLMMTVMPNGPPTMGGQLGGWFIYTIVISVFAAYVSSRALPWSADYLHVFRFAGVTAFMGYSGALWPQSIWYKKSWGTTIRSTLDGLLYALLTAGVFGWLWPR